MREREVEIDGKLVRTSKIEIDSCNILTVEAGSTGHDEGDHGSQTYLRIRNESSTYWCVKIRPCDRRRRQEIFNLPSEIEIELIGGSEFLTFVKALDFALKTFKDADKKKNGIFNLWRKIKSFVAWG